MWKFFSRMVNHITCPPGGSYNFSSPSTSILVQFFFFNILGEYFSNIFLNILKNYTKLQTPIFKVLMFKK